MDAVPKSQGIQVFKDYNITVAHLGIVVGIIDSLGIPLYIDSVPTKSVYTE
jgi:hypothetical protein